ncbi:inner membrane protein ytff [Anaeramoeba flamelloides]|uniref:Inner membrane protein ytff n=1 Tax=Anaeramoeba flamelloides TaxID=1746091 RepID=A0ABQ8Z1S5_9EUKA|nr:inner membrane protein ytff [Anaeramoeba flamelloides]
MNKQFGKNDLTQVYLKYTPGILLVHTTFGMYAVLLRYLQHNFKIQNFVLGFYESITAFVCSLSILLILRRSLLKSLIEKFRDWKFWVLIIFAAGRSISLFAAANYAKAPYIVLITNLAPFIVAVIAKFFLKEPFPRLIFPTLALVIVGAILLAIDNKHSLSFDLKQLLGIFLVFVSSICLSIYLVLVKVLTNEKTNPLFLVISFEGIIAIVNAILALFSKQTFSIFGAMGVKGVFAFLGVGVGVIFAGNLLQIWLISKSGATYVTSLLAWRVVISVLFSYIILKENVFSNAYQITGWCLIVLVITSFLIAQTKFKRKTNSKIGDAIELQNTLITSNSNQDLESLISHSHSGSGSGSATSTSTDFYQSQTPFLDSMEQEKQSANSIQPFEKSIGENNKEKN